jgi:hypothetical protein
MSNYRITTQVAGQKELSHSDVDRDESFPNPSSFDVNLAVSGDGPETCQLQR